jgi:hypothetical protein
MSVGEVVLKPINVTTFSMTTSIASAKAHTASKNPLQICGNSPRNNLSRQPAAPPRIADSKFRGGSLAWPRAVASSYSTIPVFS